MDAEGAAERDAERRALARLAVSEGEAETKARRVRAACEAVETACIAQGIGGDLGRLVVERALLVVELLDDEAARAELLAKLSASGSPRFAVLSRDDGERDWLAELRRFVRSGGEPPVPRDVRPGEAVARGAILYRQGSGRSMLVSTVPVRAERATALVAV